MELAKAVIRVSGIRYNDGMNKYPFPPTFSELDHLHWGSCKHLATYLPCHSGPSASLPQ